MRSLFAAGCFTTLTLLGAYSSFAQDADPIATNFIRKNPARAGLSVEEATSAQVSSSHTDRSSGLRYTYLQQYYKGLPVHNQILVTVWRGSEMMYHSGNFLKSLDQISGPAITTVPAAHSVLLAAQKLGVKTTSQPEQISNVDGRYTFDGTGIARDKIQASLTWTFDDNSSTMRLAWMVQIDAITSISLWNIFIDAQSGKELRRENLTVSETFHRTPASDVHIAPPPNVTDANYFVIAYPKESPGHATPSIENKPWLKAGAGNSATSLGWHFDGTSNYTDTRGNNVFAYLDLNNSNALSASNIPATSTTGAPSLTFNFQPNFSQSPATTDNRNFALTNLFYWNNIIHDLIYQYGFDEAAGNFQMDNQGRGGAGADYVKAEAQDGGGTNNANFSTPADGGSGRMQMYLWTSSNPVVRINSPSPATYQAVEGSLSTANTLTNPVTANLVYVNDATGGTHEACGTLSNAAALTGKIAVIMRGTCAFTVKIKTAQTAGALGVIVVNNVAGAPGVMSGSDNTITIPSVMIGQTDGTTLINQLVAGATVNATMQPGVAMDGDLDNGVVVHEFGHGISNRLTGGRLNAGCLGNAEQAGEGWSDYFALMMTTDWSTLNTSSGSTARAVGTYAAGQSPSGSGIRNFPYTTNMSLNPLTYNYMTNNGESHFIGEIWCAALWDMTWNIIQQENAINPNLYNSSAAGGNTIALKLVMQGLKLQPCSPGFIDGRNAILAADSILYNNAHRCAIWNAFARRGMGFSASQGSSDETNDQTPAFDLPSSIILTRNSEPIKTAPGGSFTHTIKITSGCSSLTGINIVDTIPQGFTYTASSGGTVSGNIVTFSAQSFASNQTKTFTVQLTQNANTGCPTDTVLFDNRESAVKGSLTSSGTPAWATSALFKRSGTGSWGVANSNQPSDVTLTSNAFQAYPFTYLSFWHLYNTEAEFDGGRLEISTNGGTSYIDASPYIIQNNYNKTMADAPWGAGEKAFSGSTIGVFINTVVNLSAFTGQTVRIRFRMQTDTGNPGTFDGWYLDDIIVMRGCGVVMGVAAYTSASVKLDSYSVPVFTSGTGFVTAIPAVESENIFTLTPNPAATISRLRFAQPVQNLVVVVYDAQGREIYREKKAGATSVLEIPVDQWAKGIYLIKVITPKNEYQRKLLIAH